MAEWDNPTVHAWLKRLRGNKHVDLPVRKKRTPYWGNRSLPLLEQSFVRPTNERDFSQYLENINQPVDFAADAASEGTSESSSAPSDGGGVVITPESEFMYIEPSDVPLHT